MGRIKYYSKRWLPHRTRSKSSWCIPVWLVWITGGTYDSGNGYGWRANIIKGNVGKRWYWVKKYGLKQVFAPMFQTHSKAIFKSENIEEDLDG